MKCVKHLLTNEIVRLSDDKAAALLASDKLTPTVYVYCPKHEWKRSK